MSRRDASSDVSSFHHLDSGRPSDHDLGRHADEEAALDDADDGRQPGFPRSGIGRFRDGAIGDVIAAIGRERLVNPFLADLPPSLEQQGVEKFAASWTELLDSITREMNAGGSTT